MSRKAADDQNTRGEGARHKRKDNTLVVVELPTPEELAVYHQSLEEVTTKLGSLGPAVARFQEQHLQHALTLKQIYTIKEDSHRLKEELEKADERRKHMLETIKEMTLDRNSEKQQFDNQAKKVEEQRQEWQADHKKLQSETESQLAIAKASLQQDFEQRAREDEKRVKATEKRLGEKFKEKEAGLAAEKRDLESALKRANKDKARNEDKLQKATKDVAELKMEKEKLEHAFRSLRDEKRGLQEKLDEVTATFDCESYPLDKYRKDSRHIEQSVQALSRAHLRSFEDLNSIELEEIRQQLMRSSYWPGDTPVSECDASVKLCHAFIEGTVAEHICKTIWVPFASALPLPNAQLPELLQCLRCETTDLSAIAGRKEAFWRTTTIQACKTLRSATQVDGPNQTQVDKALEHVEDILGPLLDPATRETFAASLKKILVSAGHLWDKAEVDEMVIESHFALKPEWYQDCRSPVFDPKNNACSEVTGQIPSGALRTLFPRLTARRVAAGRQLSSKIPGEFPDTGEQNFLAGPFQTIEEVLHPGCALTEDSELVSEGKQELADFEQELARFKQQHQELYEQSLQRAGAENKLRNKARRQSVVGRASGSTGTMAQA